MRKNWSKPIVMNLSTDTIQTGQICTTMQPEGQPSLGLGVPSTMCVAAASPNGILYIPGGCYVFSADANCAFSAAYASPSLCGPCPS